MPTTEQPVLCPTCGGYEYEPLAVRCDDPFHAEKDMGEDDD